MKKLRKLVKIIFINLIIIYTIILSCSSFFNDTIITNKSYASPESGTLTTVAELQTMIVDWSRLFISRYGTKCHYPASMPRDNSRKTYEKGISDDITGYYFDSIGWVDFAVHYALGINGTSSAYSEDVGIFIVPTSHVNWIREKRYLTEVDPGEKEKGDLLATTTEVAIYAGEGKMIKMDRISGLKETSLPENTDNMKVVRFTEDAVNAATGATSLEGSTSTSNPNDGTIDALANMDEIKFKYSGTPNEVSYAGKANPIRNIFSALSKFLDYLLGLTFILIKIVVIGWTNIIEWAISLLLFKLTN